MVKIEVMQHTQMMLDQLRQEMNDKIGKLESQIKESQLGHKELLETLQNLGNMGNGNNGNGGSAKSYLPLKSSIPNKYDGKALDEWNEWKEETEDYVDTIKKGLQEILKWIASQEKLEDGWTARMSKDKDIDMDEDTKEDILKESTKLWRCLKALTAGDAKNTVKSVEGQDGFKAWYELLGFYQPQVEARSGSTLAELSNMVKDPAKDISQMRTKVVGMDIKMKKIKEVTGQAADKNSITH